MMPIYDYQMCVAVQKQRLPEGNVLFMGARRSAIRQRVCLQLGDWLMGLGQWLTLRAHQPETNAQDWELA